MLFKFGEFWKTISVVVGSWIFFGIWGFEFTAITLLACILGINIKENIKFI
jgi:hypothetical protein